MHAVNTHPASASVGSGCLAYTDRVADRTSFGQADAQGLVATAYSYVVQVRHGYLALVLAGKAFVRYRRQGGTKRNFFGFLQARMLRYPLTLC